MEQQNDALRLVCVDSISAPTIVHRPVDALAALKRARKKRQKTRLEKVK